MTTQTMMPDATPDSSFDSGPFDPDLALAVARTIDPEAFGPALVEGGWARIAAARQIAHATALRVLLVLAKRGQIAGSEAWRGEADRIGRMAANDPEGFTAAAPEVAALIEAITAPTGFAGRLDAVARETPIRKRPA